MTNYADYTTDYSDHANRNGNNDGLLRIGWRNGDARARPPVPGFFFFANDSLERVGIAAPNVPQWEQYTWVNAKGEDVPGWKAPNLRMQIIGSRQQDCRVEEGRIVEWYEQRYKRATAPYGGKGWTIYVEVLAFVPGFDVPVVFASKGVRAGMAFVATMIPAFDEAVVKPARVATGQPKLARFAFWMFVSHSKKPDGSINFETPSGGATINPPALVLPNKTGNDLWQSLLVERPLFDRARIARAEFDAWLQARPGDGWQTTTPTEEYVNQPADRNVPQAINEADIPF